VDNFFIFGVITVLAMPLIFFFQKVTYARKPAPGSH